MTDLAKLVVVLEAQTAKYQAGLAAAEKKLDGFARQQTARLDRIEKGMRSFGNTVKGALGGLLAGFTLRKVIEETVKAEQELAQLDAALLSTGQSAGYNRDQLIRMAEGLSDVTTFSTGEIVEAQTRLLSYTTVVGKQFPRALQIAADQSVRLGMSFTQSAELIGRALETPSRGVTALTRQGFNFTDSQRRVLKSLEETGRLAEAQAIVMDVLEESYGGAARAARNTLGGALSALKNTVNDLMTAPSGMNGLTEAINTLAKTLSSDAVRQGFATVITGLAKMIELSAQAIAGLNIIFTGQGGNRSVDIDLEIEDLQKKRDRIMRDLNMGGYRDDFGNFAVYPESVRKADEAELDKIDAKIKELLAEQAQLFGLNGAAPMTAALAEPVAIVQKQLAALEEIAGAGEKISVGAMEEFYRKLDEKTQTSVEKQIEYLNEFESALGELLASGRISPEVYAARWNEAMDSVLEEIEPVGTKLYDTLTKEFEKTSVFWDQAFRNTTDTLATTFEDAMGGSFKRIDKLFIQMINSMAANAIAAQIGGWLFGEGGKGGGALSGVGDFLSGFLGGSRDSGGRGQKGKAYAIGVRAQPELFVPDTAGEFYPADEWMASAGGTRVTQNINFYGRQDQRSARQLAVETSRQQQIAMARLG